MENVNLMKAVVSAISILNHQRLQEDERERFRENVRALIERMDKANISWRLQNELFYIAEHHDTRDWYLDTLLKKAHERAGITEI